MQNLDELGEKESAVQVLGLGARHAGSDSKLKAWIGIALGDTVNTARAMFDYGLEKPSGEESFYFFHVEAFHAVEAACRLLFHAEPATARTEFDIQLGRYQSAQAECTYVIERWKAALTGFDAYIEECRKRATTEPFDREELRISQRMMAERCFLSGVNGDFERELKQGISWFEKSATGNDAPWIEGDRLLFAATRDSVSTLQALVGSKKEPKLVHSIEGRFRRAGELLESRYPMALSLAFRGISQASLETLPASIRDLTFSATLLEATTPELLELRERIKSARWQMVDTMSRKESPAFRTRFEWWMPIARLIPLLSQVINEDLRLRVHFSPARDLSLWRKEKVGIEAWAVGGNPHERGRRLEDFMTKAVSSSKGLRVVDVRHRNNYEEIDIIVAVTTSNPLLSYWGPLMLIECKNWKSKVGPEPVRAFYTKMISKKGAVRLGVIVSPSGFTKGVREVSRVMPDALVIALGPEELEKTAAKRGSFIDILERLIPEALFA